MLAHRVHGDARVAKMLTMLVLPRRADVAHRRPGTLERSHLWGLGFRERWTRRCEDEASKLAWKMDAHATRSYDACAVPLPPFLAGVPGGYVLTPGRAGPSACGFGRA